jgi:hypothetical protein
MYWPVSLAQKTRVGGKTRKNDSEKILGLCLCIPALYYIILFVYLAING